MSNFSATRVTPPMRLDTEALVATLKTEAVSRILRRTARGIDADDKPFAGYSAGYTRALMAGGESVDVDLRLTGGLLNSVKVIEVKRVGSSTVITIGPDTGTSPAVSLGQGRARRTGKRSPSHSTVGYWLHHGTPHMRARPWLRLSPRDREGMRQAVYRASMQRGGG
jgi:hypothetical protein